MSWYVFRINGGTICEPTDYMLVSGTPSCPGSGHLCAIQAADNGFGFPVITFSLICEIAQSLNTGSDSANVRLKS